MTLFESLDYSNCFVGRASSQGGGDEENPEQWHWYAMDGSDHGRHTEERPSRGGGAFTASVFVHRSLVFPPFRPVPYHPGTEALVVVVEASVIPRMSPLIRISQLLVLLGRYGSSHFRLPFRIGICTDSVSAPRNLSRRMRPVGV